MIKLNDYIEKGANDELLDLLNMVGLLEVADDTKILSNVMRYEQAIRTLETVLEDAVEKKNKAIDSYLKTAGVDLKDSIKDVSIGNTGYTVSRPKPGKRFYLVDKDVADPRGYERVIEEKYKLKTKALKSYEELNGKPMAGFEVRESTPQNYSIGLVEKEVKDKPEKIEDPLKGIKFKKV